MSVRQFKVSTVSADVTLQDLGGYVLVHPAVDVDLAALFDEQELHDSGDLFTALQPTATLTAEDENGIAITDPKDWLSAGTVKYDNTTSGLTATDVQTAIDEVAAGVGDSFITEFARAKANAGDVWLDRVGGLPGNLSPFRVPFACNLVRILAATRDSETWEAEVYKQPDVRSGGTPTDGNKLAELAITAANSGDSGAISVALAQGDDLGVYLRGNGISYPSVVLVFQRT